MRPAVVVAWVSWSRVGTGHELQPGRGRGLLGEPLFQEIADLLGASPLLGPVALELGRNRDELVFP